MFADALHAPIPFERLAMLDDRVVGAAALIERVLSSLAVDVKLFISELYRTRYAPLKGQLRPSSDAYKLNGCAASRRTRAPDVVKRLQPELGVAEQRYIVPTFQRMFDRGVREILLHDWIESVLIAPAVANGKPSLVDAILRHCWK